MASNAFIFANKIKFLLGLESNAVADSNLQSFADVFTLPETDGTLDQVLKTGGDGVITFGTVSSGGVDSAATTSLITTTVDSAYVQARQLTVGSGVDSSATISLITSTVDSAYVQLRTDTLITARIQVLDIADIVGAAGNPGEYLASLGSGNAEWENISTTVDSAYVQLRQDFSYASLTGAPNVLDSADVALIAGSGGVDSATTTSLITTTVDSAYVQLRQDYSYASLTGAPNVLDSADVALIAGSGGLDSASVTSLITTTVDSAYVVSKFNAADIYARTVITATAGQTVFSATYTVGYVDVFVNGIKTLNTTDYTATNGTSITLNTALSAGDIVEIVAWVPTALVGVDAGITTGKAIAMSIVFGG